MIAFSKSLQEDIREKAAIGQAPLVTRSQVTIALEAALASAREGRFQVAEDLARFAADLLVTLRAPR